MYTHGIHILYLHENKYVGAHRPHLKYVQKFRPIVGLLTKVEKDIEFCTKFS